MDGSGGTNDIPSPYFMAINKTVAERSNLYTRNTDASIPCVRANLPNTCQTEDAVTARSIRKYTI
jgi:hypothetical protein